MAPTFRKLSPQDVALFRGALLSLREVWYEIQGVAMRISEPSVASVGCTEHTDRFEALESGISRKFLELEHAGSATPPLR